MNRRKSNISLWYTLGLAALLTVGCLVASTGTTLARYRAEVDKDLKFQVAAPEVLYLGVMAAPAEDAGQTGTEVFTLSDGTNWETVGSKMQLEFAVANGTSETDFAANSQQVRVRLIGSLGLLDGTGPVAVKLVIPREPTEEDPSEYEEITAAATPIREGSTLYKTFGGGWVFSFHETAEVTGEDGTTQTVPGEELTWTLEGGKFSCIEMKMIVDNAALASPSMLKLQVIGE